MSIYVGYDFYAIYVSGIINYCISSTQRHLRCLEIVLQKGANVNSKSNDGKPVFLFACETANENEDMCLMLLAKGADPNSKNDVCTTSFISFVDFLINDCIL